MCPKYHVRHGSAYGLSAALTVDRFNGGRTNAEEAVDQAVSEALFDVRG
jgi:hypothetical protein